MAQGGAKPVAGTGAEGDDIDRARSNGSHQGKGGHGKYQAHHISSSVQERGLKVKGSPARVLKKTAFVVEHFRFIFLRKFYAVSDSPNRYWAAL
jgi:hypothetical protein